MSNTKKRKSNTPVWTLKGVSKETRAKVTKAAKKAGMTIGAYVDRVLLEASNNDLKKGAHLPAKPEEMQSQLTEIQAAIAALTKKMDEPKRSSWNPFRKS